MTPPSPARSRIMRSVRGRGNRTTERRLRAALARAGVRGFRLHLPFLPGTPDFAFPAARVAVLVHGCFWHGCPRCAPPRPRTNRLYWDRKLDANRRRDARALRALRRLGWKALVVWEHQLRSRRGRRRAVARVSRALRSVPRPASAS